MSYTLYLGDCLEYMKSMPDKSVDAVITDPPYGMNMFINDIENWKFLDDVYRIMMNDSVIYMFCGDSCYVRARTELENRFTFRRTLIWERSIGHGGNDFQLAHEYILYGWKGNPNIFTPTRMATSQASDSLGRKWVGEKTILRTPNFNNTTSERNGHPTQKPISLMNKLINTIDGDNIFDPFMGSGTTGVACMQLGRNFIGCEIDPTYYAIAEKRIKQAERQMILPLEG